MEPQVDDSEPMHQKLKCISFRNVVYCHNAQGLDIHIVFPIIAYFDTLWKSTERAVVSFVYTASSAGLRGGMLWRAMSPQFGVGPDCVPERACRFRLL